MLFHSNTLDFKLCDLNACVGENVYIICICGVCV